MKNTQKLLLLSITAFMLTVTTGCSSHKNIVSVSNAHAYNTNYGIVKNDYADKQIQEELLAMNLPTQVDAVTNMKAGWTTELTKDADSFYAHEYVEQAEVITYKYKFDKKFYKNAEWRSAEM
jgi:uncharacterized protein YceK